jgi:heme-degrading monooxygenase HmoA
MIGVFVTFRYQGNFDGDKICRIAEAARPRFEKMPGLRSKTFTFNSEAAEAVNFYVWDSEEAATAFFNEEVVQRITELYGVRPIVTFTRIATLVDNATSNEPIPPR